MNTNEKIKVMQAFDDGKTIELNIIDDDNDWQEATKGSELNWAWDRVDYRIKTEEKPLPCPFCGEKPEYGYGDSYYYDCKNKDCIIHAGSSVYESKEEALKEWNRRATIGAK